MAPPRKTSDAMIDEMIRLYEREFLELRSIAMALKTSTGNVAYWLHKRNVEMRAKHFRRPTAKSAAMQRNGMMAQAAQHAMRFRHESLIAFPPHLQAAFEAHLSDVQRERGTSWQAGIGSVSDRSAS